MHAARGPQDGRLDIVCCHWLDGREESPLIRIRSQFSINEHAAAAFARPLLQRQGDQVAEAALGHRVLVREQPVVGFQLQLPGARAGMADDRRAQATGIAGGNASGEEHPCMRAIPGPRDFQCRRNTQFFAGLHEGSRVVTPVGLVKIDSQKIAGIILQ